jgi:predicted RNA methylase
MSIYGSSIEKYTQNLVSNFEKKSKYGEIFTPFSLIQHMLELLPISCFQNKNSKWLDPGAGTGYFSMLLYWKLNKELSICIPDSLQRHNHIIRNMIYMIEIQDDNVSTLVNVFGNDANIVHGDIENENFYDYFDYIIGNPPYNSNGIKKVPTNKKNVKKKDGHTIWISFVKHSLSFLKPNGKLLMITPSIWMKPDKAQMYHYMLQYRIEYCRCFSNTKTNQIFSGQAQTPTCIFLLSKERNNMKVKLYDNEHREYVDYSLEISKPIPVYGASVISKLQYYVKNYGILSVKKTNTPRKHSTFVSERSSTHKFLNIKTALLDGSDVCLKVEYSDTAQSYYGKPKVVLPHKMYGFPFLDYSGKYGISSRDNYVIDDYTIEELKKIKDFLGTFTTLYLFECTRYRMKYLEKYIFELIPNFLEIPNFPSTISDATLFEFFKFEPCEIEGIKSLHNKNYSFIYK